MKEKEEETAIIKKPKPKKSIKETITLMMRKRWLTSTTQTILLVAILCAIFLGINLYCQSIDLPEIDVTENKIYTLSDSSKDVIKKIDKDVKVYIYGYEEDDSLVSFIKQYAKVNDHIKYELLSEETNLAKVQEFELSQGYKIVILETEESKKVIDASYEFQSYDYNAGQEVDLTEQKLTNSLIAITADVKPKVYFTTGHEEYNMNSDLAVLTANLMNEGYDATTLDLIASGAVPEDCNLLVILSPFKDFMEAEVNAVLDYINKGGNIIITSDVGNFEENYPNVSKIYEAYGVSMDNKGYVYETNSGRTAANYPYIFTPLVATGSDITTDIYSENGQLWLVYAGRLNFKSDEELKAMNVTKEDLLTSTEEALFITDVNSKIEDAVKTAKTGKSTISALMTKTITPAVEASEGVEAKDAVESKMVIIANGRFIADYKVEQLSTQYPISYLGNNKDFMLNSVAKLTDRDDTIKIRKDMSTSTYTPTQEQHTVVVAILFAVPIIIILIGIIVWNIRRHKR